MRDILGPARQHFGRRLAAHWEVLITCLDMVPQPEEAPAIAAPPEKARPSIKRCIRKSSLQARPPRTWEAMDYTMEADEFFALEPQEEAVSVDLPSFRTAVHKALYKARNDALESFRALVRDTAASYAQQLKLELRREQDFFAHWNRMLGQLGVAECALRPRTPAESDAEENPGDTK